MIEKIRPILRNLNFSINRLIPYFHFKYVSQLGLDLKSLTLGFVSAFTIFGLLSSMYAEYHLLGQWIAWVMVFGLSWRLNMDSGKTLQPFPCQAVGYWQNSPHSVLDKTNQLLWQILQKQAIAKQKLKATNQKLLHLATIDGLTQVKNRYFFNQKIHHEWQRLQREQQPLSLILFDVDYFKRYNDFYGHQAGDLCLQEIAQVAQKSLHRPADFIARYGGEEFAVVLPNTSKDGAITVAQRIQKSLKTLAIPHQSSGVSSIISVSLGIAHMIPTEDVLCESLIEQADQALYHAKEMGRDRYIVV